MAFDLGRQTGMIIDGSGLPRYRVDVGGRMAKSARSPHHHGRGEAETLDARCHGSCPAARSNVHTRTMDPREIFCTPNRQPPILLLA